MQSARSMQVCCRRTIATTSRRYEQVASTSAAPSAKSSFKANRRHFDSLSKRESTNSSHHNLVDNPSIRFTIRPAPSPIPSTLPASPVGSSQFLPPALRPENTGSEKRLNAEEIAEMQALRLSDPTHWTRSRLAQKYGVSSYFVGIQGFGESTQGQAAAKMVKEGHQRVDAERRTRWGFKKRVDREVRLRRRELW